MKKIKYLVLLIIVLMGTTVSLISCNKSTQCNHIYAMEITSEATCVTDGEMIFTCYVCGDSYTESIPATGRHNYTNKTTIEATCINDGVKTFTCSVCNDSYTEAIAATGMHNYTSKVTAEATCVEDGIKTLTCSVCNDSYTEVIAVTGEHNYVCEVTAEATCTEDGVKTFTCSACNDSYTEVIAATGEHNYVCEVTTEATCTEDGVKTFTCSACNDSYTEVIAAAHKWADATCTTAKTCSVCKLTEGYALAHQIENGQCTRCGLKISVILYEDSNVKITFKKVEKTKYFDEYRAELYFYVENKTGRTLLIQADAIALNGFTFSSLIMSDEVLPYTIGVVKLTVREFDFDLVDINNITRFGGQFRIIDDATWKSYDAIFPQ